jgi:hypothetical protein
MSADVPAISEFGLNPRPGSRKLEDIGVDLPLRVPNDKLGVNTSEFGFDPRPSSCKLEDIGVDLPLRVPNDKLGVEEQVATTIDGSATEHVDERESEPLLPPEVRLRVIVMGFRMAQDIPRRVFRNNIRRFAMGSVFASIMSDFEGRADVEAVRDINYILREAGFKTIPEPEFAAEGPTDFLSRLASYAYDTSTDLVKNILGFIERVWGSLVAICEGIVPTMRMYLISAKDKLCQIVVNYMLPEGITIELSKLDWTRFTRILLVLMAALLTTMGVINLAAFKYLWGTDGVHTQYSCEGPLNVIGVMVTMVVGALGSVSERTRDALTGKLGWLAKILTSASVVGAATYQIFMLLPTAVRTTLIYHLGTKDQVLAMEAEDWLVKSTSLSRCASDCRILAHPRMLEEVEKAIRQGRELVKNVVKEKRPIFYKVYHDLVRISRNLYGYHNVGCCRPTPYGIHLYGAAGVGKSTVMEQLVSDILDKDHPSIFTRSAAEPFWSGFIDQEVVFMDEFLIGNNDFVAERAREYLTLVSNQNFVPSMPSLDMPSVGVKGTRPRPKIVITANNEGHSRPHGVDVLAYQRRRNVVIQLTPIARFLDARGRPDFERMTEEEVRNAAWLEFTIHPGIWNPECGRPGAKLTYQQMIEYVKQDYAEFVKIGEKIMRAQGNTIMEIDPEELIAEITRGDIGLEPLTFKNIVGFIPDLLSKFVSEGKNNRRASQRVNKQVNKAVVPTTVPMTQEGSKADLNQEVRIPDEYSEMKRQSYVRNLLEVGRVRFNDSLILAQLYLPTTDQISNFIKNMSRVFVVANAVYGICKLVAGMMGGRNELQCQSFEEVKKEKAKSYKEYKMSKGLKGAQGPSDYVNIKLATAVGSTSVHGMAIGGRYVITYYHTLGQVFKENDFKDVNCTVIFGNNPYTFVLNADKIQFCANEDFVAFQVEDPNYPTLKSRANRFVTDYEAFNTEIYQVSFGLLECKFAPASVQRNIKYTSMAYGNHCLDYAVTYRLNTNVGDCGKIVRAIDPSVNGKILGMHVAGSVEKGPNSVGVCNIITKEMIKGILESNEVIEVGDLETQGVLFKQRLKRPLTHMPDSTKIRPSKIAQYLPWSPEKFPAVLRADDSRNESGVDPVERHVATLEAVKHPEVDLVKVKVVFDTMVHNYKQKVKFTRGNRDLTIEEAVGGIPGFMKGLDLNTSPGWPLSGYSRKPGKKTWIKYSEDGSVEIDDFLRSMVNRRIEEFERGEEREHISLGYLKDELVSLEKVRIGKTRVIYAPDLVNTIVMRMKYGMLFQALITSRGTGIAMGLNPQSFDMNELYQELYLPDGYFVAGDYKGFDCNIVPEFRDGAIELLNHLVGSRVSDNMKRSMSRLMSELTMVIGSIKFRPSSMNASGSVFTTHLNCLVNEAYMRYTFLSVCPGLRFDDCVRIKCHGDDHLLCTTKATGFSGKVIQNEMKKLNQVYTNDDKMTEIPDWRNFDEITFLGTHPVKYLGRWTGALRKSSMNETLYWTRDFDATLVAKVNQVLDYASQWPEEVYAYYLEACTGALSRVGVKLERPCYTESKYIVANRITSEPLFKPEDQEFVPEGDRSLTTFSAVREREVSEPSDDVIVRKAMSERPGSLDFSTDSSVFRYTYTWLTSHNKGAILGSFNVPHGLLEIGESRNLQNMPFERYIYWRGDVELTIQINGNPFQQGYLVLFWYPLSNEAQFLDIHNWTSCRHIVLTPRGNTTATLRVPFRFPRGALNTYAFGESDESLGSFALGVLSPLVQAGDTTMVEVSVYSRFPDSQFYLPRPLKSEGAIFMAEGQGISRATYNYNISHVAGDVPIETTTAKMENEANLPMDNPPLSSGAVPMVPAFSGMSKAIGLEPTTSFAMHPALLTRSHNECFDSKETKIEWLLSQPGYLGSFNWVISDGPSKILHTMDLNSGLGLVAGSNHPQTCPPNVALINMFNFWRADIELELVAVKTAFHSGRIRVAVGYGAPDVMSEDLHVFYNQVLDFGPDVDRHSFIVPYNQVTEYLRTWDMGAEDPLQDYSLGHLAFAVANALRAPPTVSTVVEMLLFAKFVNVRVAVPRPLPNLQIVHRSQNGASRTWQPQVIHFDVEPQGPPIETPKDLVDDANHDSEPTEIADVKQSVPPPMCTLKVGEKFEYVVTDINEMVRRHHVLTNLPYLNQNFERMFVDFRAATDPDQTNIISEVVNLPVTPMDLLRTFYAAWGGSLKYRIFRNEQTLNPVVYYPLNTKGIDQTWKSMNTQMYDTCAGGALPAEGTKFHVTRSRGGLSTYGPKEMAMPIAGSNFIDVSVPFLTQFNFCLTSSPKGPTDVGYIAFDVYGPNEDMPKCQVFQAAGDDFSYGVYRPPIQCATSPFQRDGLRLGAFNMAGQKIIWT